MKQKALVLLSAIALMSSSAFAADIAAGKSKAAMCAGCHGPEGISYIPNYPNLKGQKAAYTEKQLRDFKEKRRVEPVMAAQASMLSDEDIKNVSAFYESLGNK